MMTKLTQKIAIISSPNNWFIPYAQQFVTELTSQGCYVTLYHHYNDLKEPCDIVFLLNYLTLVPTSFLQNYPFTFVVHESALPAGKGLDPLIWQVLEGKNSIPFTLFKATENLDEGDIFLQDHLILDGTELYEEIREKQAQKTLELCRRFLEHYTTITPSQQKGRSSFYVKRTPAHYQLPLDKPLQEVIPILRAANEKHPAFFYFKGKKYLITIKKSEKI